jgi:hypothetical protein
MTCPSELKLETYLLAPGRSSIARHVTDCDACQGRLAEMKRLADEFQREVYPGTVGAIERSGLTVTAAARQRSLPRWKVWGPPLAAVAALLLAFLWRERQGGGALHLAVFVEAPSGVAPVRDGAAVAADASLRFQVQPRSPCNLWVLSVNGAGDIVRLYPPKGDRAAELEVHPPRRHDLPTVALLDGRAGPQRIFAVCTPAPVPWNTVKTAAAGTLQKGDAAVRSFRSIDGLPAGATQTTVLVEKRS